MDDTTNLYQSDHNDHQLCEEFYTPAAKTGRSEEMETDSRENQFSHSIDQRLLQQSLQRSLGSIRNFLPSRLVLWINESLNLLNLKEFETTVFPQFIENAIDPERKQLPSRLSNTFVSTVIQQAKLEWNGFLSTFSKAISTYGSNFSVKLEIQGHLQPDKFELAANQLLSKCLAGVTDALARELIALACQKIKNACQVRNTWLFENGDKMERKVLEIRKRYCEEIAKVEISDKKSLLGYHAQLKETLVQMFKAEIHVPETVGEGVLVRYITPLNGHLNAEYDRFVSKKLSPLQNNGKDNFKVDEVPSPVTTTTENKVMARTQNKKNVSAELKRKEAPLFYNVREENDLDHTTRVGDTDIYYFDRKIISRGSSAIVYEGRFGTAAYGYHHVAVKHIFRSDENEFENELKIWAEIAEASGDSVYVARLLSYKEWTKELYLVIELADMDLGKKVASIKSSASSYHPCFPKLVGYIQDVSKGLHWLHSKNIIHRDIKPGNILIYSYSQNGGITETAKLTDFGISRIAKEFGQAETRADGTVDWAAPEVLRAKNQEEKFVNTKLQDIFSFGLTAHFTLSLGEHPFAESEKHGKMKILNILDESVSPSKLPHPQYIANDLIQAMIKKSPADRPTSAHVLKHPLFWNVERALEFVIDFARIVDEKIDEEVKTFRENVDQQYSQWYKDVVTSENTDVGENTKDFDWKEKMGTGMFDTLQKRKMNKGKKNYGGHSVVELVELIRDKYMHSGDMVDELKTDEHFGKDGVFSAQKYGQYFLNMFPDLLVFLKSIVLSDCCDEYPDLKQLRGKYF